MKNFEELFAQVEALRPDIEKQQKGNKAATTRLRVALQQIKRTAQAIRVELAKPNDNADIGIDSTF